MTFNGEATNKRTTNVEIVPDDCILIAGAGPVGLLLAVVLSYYGVKSILLERNPTTTKYVTKFLRTLQEEISKVLLLLLADVTW